MIHLEKPNDAPPLLLNRGAMENRKNCEAYIRTPARYNSGDLKFDIKQNIYGSPHHLPQRCLHQAIQDSGA